METVVCERNFYYDVYIKDQLLFEKGRSYKWEYETSYYIGRIKVHLEYSHSYYTFSREEFKEYFVSLKVIRKLKLERINENRRD